MLIHKCFRITLKFQENNSARLGNGFCEHSVQNFFGDKFTFDQRNQSICRLSHDFVWKTWHLH